MGQQFTIPVRVRAVGKAMLAFQFRLQFPSSLSALSCSVGADFVGSFACTLNSPPTSVLIIGSDPNGVSGADVQIATVTMVGTQAGVARAGPSFHIG